MGQPLPDEEKRANVFWRNAHGIFSRQTVAWSQFERHQGGGCALVKANSEFFRHSDEEPVPYLTTAQAGV